MLTIEQVATSGAEKLAISPVAQALCESWQQTTVVEAGCITPARFTGMQLFNKDVRFLLEA
jgi:hypothetical protein